MSNEDNKQFDELLEQHDLADVTVRKFGSKIVKAPLTEDERREFVASLKERNSTHDALVAMAEGRAGTVAQTRAPKPEQRVVVSEPPRATGAETRSDELAQVKRELDALKDAQEQRDLADAMEAARRKLNGRGASRQMSTEDKEIDQQIRSAVLERDPAPIVVPISGRTLYSPGAEQRDLLKVGGTGTQAMGVSVFDRITQHLVEGSAILRAGATLLTTETGEDLQVPKSTGFSTAAQIAEASLLGESDPVLGVVTLKSYKYGFWLEISHELANDSRTDLVDFLARQSAIALSQAFGNDLINGDGSGKPRGVLLDAGTGVTGPTGTSTSLGVQATAGMGTDLLYDLYGSMSEPYVVGGNLGWIMRNATATKIRKIKCSDGKPVGWPEDLGPVYVDSFVPAMAANAKSIILGDWSRYFFRLTEGFRWERSDAPGFTRDVVTFRGLVRVDGAVIDANAFKVFVNSAT